MLFSSILAGLALAAAPALAIPPPDFGFPDSDNHTELTVAYTFNGNTTIVQEGMLLGGNITSQQPALSVNTARYQSLLAYTGSYILIMVDPDASTPENPTRRFILHWLATNLTQSTTVPSDSVRQLIGPSSATNGSAPDFVPYLAPAPPFNSSAHRYILYLFQQPTNFAIPAQFAALQGGANRTAFNLTDFIAAAALGRPAAAEYLYVNRQPQVPGTFVALAGGVYPGGNGGAIFEGSVPSTAPTGTGAATGAGAASPTAATAGAAGGWSGFVAEGLLGAAIWGIAALL